MNIRIQKVPALVLAAALQVVPLARVAVVDVATAPSGFAIVFRWLAGAAALLGSYEAVSGASAAVVGLANLSPPGPLTNNATVTVGQTFVYRIVVTNPGVNPLQAFYNAAPLPPGLTINTNIGANNGVGEILGTPTTPGVWAVLLTAGNANYANVVTTNVTITIKSSGGNSPPQVTVAPTNQVAVAGTNVSFTATATGTAPLSYIWKFAGTAVPGATTSVLSLSNVQTNSTGLYTVTVTNTAGSASASANLTVNNANAGSPPLVTVAPTNQVAVLGTNVSFTATATGTAPLSYSWSFAGAAIAGATTSVLNLSSVQTNGTGLYTVTVTNAAGSASASAALTVDVPPSITSQPQNVTVTNGNGATFTVSATGLPLPTYQWQLNGSNLAGQTQSTLTISNAQAANAGPYTVVVSNPVGSITSLPAQLTVHSTAGSPLTLANLQWTGTSLTFSVSGPVQTNYVIWTSPDLTTWSPFQTNFSANGSVQVTDSSTSVPARFYRATLSP